MGPGQRRCWQRAKPVGDGTDEKTANQRGRSGHGQQDSAYGVGPGGA